MSFSPCRRWGLPISATACLSFLCAPICASPDWRSPAISTAHVAAPAQARFLDAILPHLTDEEQAIYRRGRNTHVHGVPKNATHGEYAKATGLEALLGSLWLSGQQERINELFCLGMEDDHAL